MVSLHYNLDRYYREMFIYNYLGGDGEIVDSFIVDKGHRNGLERHCITNHGLIIVYNVNTKKMVTKLIARPQQVKRYYVNTNKRPPRKGLRAMQGASENGF
jgi:hypothetical protein